MNKIIEKLNQLTERTAGKFKPDLVKYGKNFRAISESAVLDALNPVMKELDISYEVYINNTELTPIKYKAGADSQGNIIERVLFLANCIVEIKFLTSDEAEGEFRTMGWGSGIDSGDKATGKAFTAAVKYALFKGLRLRYSDDPDAEASEEIEEITEKKSHEKSSGDGKEKTSQSKKESKPVVSEKMLSYIKGLLVESGTTDEAFKKKYGYAPYDENMPMEIARKAIDDLKPF